MDSKIKFCQKKITWVVLIIAVISVSCVSAFAVENELSSSDINLQQTVEHFRLQNEPLLSGLAQLGAKANIPIGVVMADETICSRRVSINVPKGSVQSILKKLTRSTGYGWRVENGVLILRPRKTPESAAKLMHLVIPRYSVPAGSIEVQTSFLQMAVRAKLKPHEGTAGDILSSPQSPKFPALTIENASVNKILNALVSRAGRGVWVLFPLKSGGYDFSVVGYGEPDLRKRALCPSITP